MIDFIKKKIDWEICVERKNPIFYNSIANVGNGRLSKKITGFGLKYQINYIKDGDNIFYWSKNESLAGKKYFLKLIENKPKTLLKLAKQGRFYLKKEKQLVSLFSRDIKSEYIEKNYKKIVQDMENIFTHLSIIPRLILNAIDGADDNNKNSKPIMVAKKLFFPFRKTSRNILQDTVLLRIYKAAAEICNYNGGYLDFSFLTTDELGECLKKKKFLFKKDVEKRKRGCALTENGINGKLVFNYQKDFLKKIGIKNDSAINYNAYKEVRGTVASPGKARGRVCIVNKPSEMMKCQGKYVVVSVCTKPALIPILVRCQAMVTNEGGLSCHASIISRELKKPCVVGTKIATKVFKDEDLIEVDANNGTVRIIS